ncbi:hypothetical protein vseg_021030 [Gypsophila vaccaria]
MVAVAFVQYYKHLLGTHDIISPFPSLEGPQLQTNSIAHLTLPFSDQEIRRTVFGIDIHKSLGPDGYSSGFFKHS